VSEAEQDRPGAPGDGDPPAPGDTLGAVIERYRRLESALLYDVLDRMGLPNQQLSLEIAPLDVDMVVAGEAFTEKMVVAPPDAALPDGGSNYAALDAVYPGCVVVQDVGNDPISGGLGENAGLSVRLAGAVGVVCDGGTRDRKALIKAGFPVFSRFSTCTFSWGRRRFLAYQIPVRLSGHLTRWVTVNPGDFVFGDCDGLLVIPRSLTLEALAAAERVATIEEEQRRRLRAGEPRAEVYRQDRYAHVRRAVPAPPFPGL
jgi:4-hydroxy-4-methyl-2-oxoglutarate aldolase